MLLRIIRNDISRGRVIALTTAAFVAVASLLVSLAAVLTVNLVGAIDTLMARAKTPHFMQMHSGEIDTERLAAFAEETADVEAFQVLEFLNLPGADILIGESSLAGSLQDNGVCTQSASFDYLLDLSGNPIHPLDGEVYLPIGYWKDGTAKAGDSAQIGGIPFTVAGFLRDSQMNSMLSSSKRLLVSEGDFARLQNAGETEYLIEFRLKDVSALRAFEAAYVQAELESNGPTITYPLFRMINAMEDGIMIAVILLVSLLVVGVAFLCVRFTLLAKMEEDYREIGVMKAIGLRVSDIQRIYMAKYAALAAVGSACGYALSFAFRGTLLENIRLYMGQSDSAGSAHFFAAAGALLVFLLIVAYVRRVLKKFRTISAAQAIRFGAPTENASGTKRPRLSQGRLMPVNLLLGMKDVLSRKKLYGTMLAVLVLAGFIMIVPQNMLSTITADEFVTHIGVGECDLLINVQQTEDIASKMTEIEAALSADEKVAQYAALTTRTAKAKLADGSVQHIKIDLGDHTLFPVAYAEGGPPKTEGQIALSTLNADELGMKVGDAMTVMLSEAELEMTVCGTYSDITNGGKTAKASIVGQLDNADEAIMWGMLCVKLSDPAGTDAMVKAYAERFHFAKVSGIRVYFAQTLGSTTRTLETASYASVAVALLLSALVTLLFMKLLVAKDRYAIAVLKALGFTGGDITAQFIARAVLVLTFGIVLGTLLANTLGEVLTGMMLGLLGASSFRFTVNPLSAYLLCPALMAATVLCATLAGTSGKNNIKIYEGIKE